MQIEIVDRNAAHKIQNEIRQGEPKNICTNFCQSTFLNYHETRNEYSFNTKYVSGIVENKQFILPLSIPENRNMPIVSHFGSPYSGLCINSDKPEVIRSAYGECVRLLMSNFEQYPGIEIRLPPNVISSTVPAHEWSLWSLGFSIKTIYLGRFFEPASEIIFNRNRRRRLERIKSDIMNLIIDGTPSQEAYSVVISNRTERHAVKPTHTFEDLVLIEKLNPGLVHTFQISHGNTPCSVAIIFEDYTFSTIQYLAGSPCSFDCGSQDILVKRIIEEYKNKNKILLFGTSTEPADDHKTINSGLDNFKESFGSVPYTAKWFSKASSNSVQSPISSA